MGVVAGAWTYHEGRGGVGDNSNTQYALLGLNAAAEAGVAIPAEVWQRRRGRTGRHASNPTAAGDISATSGKPRPA